MEHLKGLAEYFLFAFKVLCIIKFFNIAEVSWDKIIMPIIMTFVMLGIMYLISQEVEKMGLDMTTKRNMNCIKNVCIEI